MASKKRILWIDQLKGIAFLLVILGHSYKINDVFRSYLYSFHMPLFLMVSGLNLNIDRMYETSFFSYFYKLFKRMIVPYVWLNFFSLTVRYFLSVLVTHKPLYVGNYIRGMFLSNTQLEAAPCPAAPTYYIILLFLAQLLFWLIVKVTKKSYTGIGICCIVLCSVSIVTQSIPLIWHINVVPVAVFWLFIGKLLMDFYKRNSTGIHSCGNIKLSAICIGLFALGFLLWLYNGRVSIHGNKYGEDFVMFVLAAVATSVATAIVTIKLPDTKVFTFVGKNTLFFLGTHTVLMLIINEIFKSVKNEPWYFLLQSAIAFVVLIPAAFAANKLIPWANGNPLRKKTVIIEVCKFLSIAAAGFVPCNHFINKFAGGILESTAVMRSASVVGYILLCVAVYFMFNRYMKFMFIIEDK